MDTVGLRAIAYALPEAVVDLAALARAGLLHSPVSLLEEFGFAGARVSDQPADELARLAVQRLLDENAIDPESIDLLFFAGALPSSHFLAGSDPVLAGFNYPVARLQYECGLLNATATGISQTGCAGLMAAVALAADHLRASRSARRILCVGADVLPAATPREIIFNVISDGACAVLVERGAVRNRVLGHARITKGYYWHAGVSRNEIVAAYFPTARTLLADLLTTLALEPASLAAVLPHNVSRRSWEILLPMLGIPATRLYADNIARIGHVIAADNFINLQDALAARRVRAGDAVLLFTFGFGANWAAMVLEA